METTMPYPVHHKPRTRERIVNSAAKLFSRAGFDNVSIDQIMLDAGLTRGAFYSHFADKSALYAEAIQHTSQQRFKRYTENFGTEKITPFIEAYLSSEHLNADLPCALGFLVTDISQRNQQVRDTYTQVYERLLKGLASLGTDHTRTQQQCLAASALLIGGVAIARALNNETLIQELLEACKQVSHEVLNN
jgi:TetR/AcrR family transcriptional repressor of nem operon